MINRLTFALIMLIVLLSAGCANFMSIHHTFKPDEGDSISIDAKQRVVYSVKKTYGDNVSWRAVCAEPSPDALAAISASSGLSADNLKVALSAALGIQEGAASIGLRTQTIQILRDAMYRLCEGYASGALDDIAFSRLQRRYQNIMLGLLAIEQLTGVVSPKQVALFGGASSSVGKTALEINKALNEAKGLRRESKSALEEAATKKKEADDALQAAKAEYQKKLAANNNDSKADEVAKYMKDVLDPAQVKAANQDQAYKTKKAIFDDTESSVASLEKALDSYGKIMATAIVQGNFDGGISGTTISNENAAVIAGTVQGIVRDIVIRDYSKETCLDSLVSRYLSKETEQFKLVMHYCAALIQAEIVRIHTEAAQAKDSDKPALKQLGEAMESQRKAFVEAINSYKQTEQSSDKSNSHVDCINKADRPGAHERIQNIGGLSPGRIRWKLSHEEAITGIESGKWNFFVIGPTAGAIIVAKSTAGKKYLKTKSDGEHPNDLLSLPECPK